MNTKNTNIKQLLEPDPSPNRTLTAGHLGPVFVIRDVDANRS
jgi:hypothetical protein